eukprot:jgi/Mesen1/2758/ME000017S02130
MSNDKAEDTVSIIALDATELVREAQRRHKLAPTATAALGRLLMGTLLMAALKDGSGETVQIMFSGRGPLGQMTAVATTDNFVKGYVANPACDPPLKPNGKMDVGAAVGAGVLTVVRSHPEWVEPYSGTVPLQTGEVAEDLAHYLAESEQINSALSLGVSIGRDSHCLAARGFLVQVLPFCSDATLQQVEENVLAMPNLSTPSQDLSPQHLIQRLLSGIGMDEPTSPMKPGFGPCKTEELRPRMLQAVESLGSRDIQALLDERGVVEVRCEFCAETVHFGASDLKDLLQAASTPPL